MKGIAGFYYVHVSGKGIYECKAKGIFRKLRVKPMVGDWVIIEELNSEGEGNICELLPRKNQLLRPEVCNVDQAVIIFAVKRPEPNLHLLDRFLIQTERQGVKIIVCFNKCDLAVREEIDELIRIYQNTHYKTVFTSACTKEGLEEFYSLLIGKTTSLAGPSGVGKSSIINCMQDSVFMETGEISTKVERGKHTTRHSELIPVNDNTYIMDTPGFSSLYLKDMREGELKNCFPEFYKYEGQCRFQGCSHIKEPDCAVKAALKENEISKSRYENYVDFYQEIKNQRRY